jgi:eukaryotic-like serine/threonine-protein kinase
MGRAGRYVGDRYRLVEKLGTGGMSVVWRGYDEVLGREVAIKVLSPQLAGDLGFRDRMRREALAAARLCHPHITGIFDFGESPLSGQLTVPYVVMELNDGESVAARLAGRGPIGWRDAVVIAAEVASALATAHAHGVVHRDVTPANVMLTSTGAKVVDFGISALVGECDTAPDGSLLGTPAYLAPERLAGSAVSPATDVYALGLLLYRALTARLPWPAENTAEALRAHLYAEPEPLPPLPGLPREVAELCLHCLAKSPGDRPSAAEVAARLGATVGAPPLILAPAVSLTWAAFEQPARTAGVRPSPAASVLAYLGLPEPRTTRAFRLRAGLRVGQALRLGGAQPLGGGLFAGGRLGRSAAGYMAGRHRLQAAVATLTLVSVVSLVWSSTREQVEVGTAQAAAAGPGVPVGVRHAAKCKVRYQVVTDSGDDFEARLTVVNTGDRALGDWRMEFAYPGTQRLTDPAGEVAQNGRKVVLAGRRELAAGRSVTVTLRGAYRGSNPLPLVFKIDGSRCQAEVLGATTLAAEQDPSASPSSSPSTAPERKKSPRKKVAPPPPAPSSKAGGFSISA